MVCKWETVRGCLLLARFLAADGSPSQRELAKRLGVREGLVYFWKVGFRRPGPEFRQALLRICRIPVDAWLTSAERKAVRRLRAA